MKITRYQFLPMKRFHLEHRGYSCLLARVSHSKGTEFDRRETDSIVSINDTYISSFHEWMFIKRGIVRYRNVAPPLRGKHPTDPSRSERHVTDASIRERRKKRKKRGQGFVIVTSRWVGVVCRPRSHVSHRGRNFAISNTTLSNPSIRHVEVIISRISELRRSFPSSFPCALTN